MKEKLKKAGKTADPIYFVFIWFGLTGIYTFLFYHLIGYSPQEVKQPFSMVFGFIMGLYSLTWFFNWSKTKKRGAKRIEVHVCEHCGKDNELNDPPAPAGYKSAWTFIMLPPVFAMYASATIGFLLQWTPWQIYILCASLLFTGFAVVRIFKLAPIDDRALHSNVEWKRYHKELEERSKDLVCLSCGKKLFS